MIFLKDFLFGIRLARKHPGFTVLAVVILALGIGANSAIFSIVNTLVLKPMAVQSPEQLVGCFSKNTENPDSYRQFSYPNFKDIQRQNAVFSDLMAHSIALVGITEGDTTRRTFAELVSANYFRTFGVELLQGRAFTEKEEAPESRTPVAIVSYEYWRKRGQDPDLLGKTLRINGQAHTIIGITRKGFTGRTVIALSEVWLPLGMYEETINDFMGASGRSLADRDNHCLFVAGRLKSGQTMEEANAHLGVLASQLEMAYPKENEHQTVITAPMSRVSLSTDPGSDDSLGYLSIVLSFMAGMVLLIACLNLASMLLARSTVRRKEIAIRLALGSGRMGLIRQLLAEGFLLSILGGLAGVLIASWGVKWLISSVISMSPIPLTLNAGIDLRVLIATLLFCIISTLIFALGPAWKSARSDIITNLKEDSAPGTFKGRPRFLPSSRNMLVIGQLSLSLTLIAASGLLIRSAHRAAAVNPGFRLEGCFLMELDAGMIGYNETRGRNLYRGLLERLAAHPGIQHASLAATVPFGPVSMARSVQRAEGASSNQPDNNSVGATFNAVSDDYFRTLGIPVLRGRAFNEAESQTESGPRVAIVDVNLAGRLWPEENPIGRRIVFRSNNRATAGQAMEVVGIVGNVRYSLRDNPDYPNVYVPFGQDYQSDIFIHLKAEPAGPAAEASLLQAARREIRNADANLPVFSMRTFRRHLDESFDLWIYRTGARMFGVFGALALFLAVAGVYGLISFSVARRVREIGIRIALGATPADTLKLILSQGLRLTLWGIGIGLLLALGVGRLLSSMLYEIRWFDPALWMAAPLLLAAASLFASYVPTRRAMRIDPMEALRSE